MGAQWMKGDVPQTSRPKSATPSAILYLVWLSRQKKRPPGPLQSFSESHFALRGIHASALARVLLCPPVACCAWYSRIAHATTNAPQRPCQCGYNNVTTSPQKGPRLRAQCTEFSVNCYATYPCMHHIERIVVSCDYHKHALQNSQHKRKVGAGYVEP